MYVFRYFIFFNILVFCTSYQESKLLKTVKKLRRNGILAMDESIPTIAKRFSENNIKNTKLNRKKYRNLLLQTPDLNKYVSGCILYEETATKNNLNFLKNQGILAGIKLDEGLQKVNKNEYLTKGILNVQKKCETYKFDFAKWRSVFLISASKENIVKNCELLAQYASICQQNGIVPIVEPELLTDGNHTIYETAKLQEKILNYMFNKFHEYNITLESMILKTNMVVPGNSSSVASYPTQVANLTVQTFERCVPSAVPVIALLSGGIEEKMVFLYFKHIKKKIKKAKWYVTFSFGRALQSKCLNKWKNKKKNVYGSQKILLEKLMSIN